MYKFESVAPSAAVRLIGHPFAPSGMGEHIRSVALALSAAGVAVELVDVWGHHPVNQRFMDDFEQLQRRRVDRQAWTPPDLDIFAVNCDEIERVRTEIGVRHFPARRSVLYPAWELPELPHEWVEIVREMDELWVSSGYTQQAFLGGGIEAAVVGLSVRRGERRFATRRDLGLPEGVHCTLTSVHLASYAERKNPLGAARAVAAARSRLSSDGIRLVVKVSGSSQYPEEARLLNSSLIAADPKVVILTEDMPEGAYRSLTISCDSVVSMHRAEGFGFAIAEAMRLGRPVVCTGYSGNMDFCSEANSGIVDFDLVRIPNGAYPHGDGQVWAEPDYEAAGAHLASLVANPQSWETRVLNARVTASTNLSHFAVGLRMAQRIREVVS